LAPSLDIGIAGAGPAGLAAALALRRQGHRVEVFDQFDAPKPVGSGLILQPTGLAVLDWLGLGQRMRSLGARIDRLYGKACGTGRVVLDVRYEALGAARGLAVHRAALFNVLIDAASADGIAVKTQSRVAGLDGTSLAFDDGRREGPFDLVIDALGSRSPLIAFAAAPDIRKRLGYGAIWTSLPWPEGFDPHALEQRYDKASVMIGVLPIGMTREGEGREAAFFWSLKTGDHDAWKQEGLGTWKSRVLRLWPETAELLDTIADPAQMVLASYDHHTLPLPFGERLAFIGDSAHATSPQLGQGANMALLDVYALAQALDRAPDISASLGLYARARRNHVRLYQALSRIFTPFYQSDSHLLPFIRDRLVAPLSRAPGAQQLLASIVSGRLGLPKRALP
jgi:salicylate hydroxylase